MKRIFIIIISMVAMMCVVSCSKNEEKGLNAELKKTIDSVDKVVYHLPNEALYTFDEADKVSEICDIIKEQTYTKQEDNQELIEGNYMLDLVGEETVEIGLAGNTLIYDGEYYVAEDEEAFEEIYAMLQEI